jgi:hypothetical protein
MRAARIDNGLVADLWMVPSLDCYGPEVILVEAPDHVQLGASYDPVTGFTNTPEQVEALQRQMISAITNAIQNRLDEFARQRNYDNILSACTFATSKVTKFKAEGQACVNLRDATWAAAYDILAKVQAGQRPMPASLADIEADLPALEWPQ